MHVLMIAYYIEKIIKWLKRFLKYGLSHYKLKDKDENSSHEMTNDGPYEGYVVHFLTLIER